MNLLIGTSGWSYDEWVGPFYPKKKGKFTHYTKYFNTAEINSTFYRYPSEGLIAGLNRNAPPGFTFAAKLPQIITHEKWLDLNRGVEEDTHRFLELMKPLAEKLGPILIQLRPKFNYDDHMENLETYLEAIPGNYEWAVEFRHKSWMREETYKLLTKHNTAYTIVDEPLLPPETHVTADFAYIRWHGHGSRLWYDYDYNGDQLEEWVPKVYEVTGKARRTYGYFNNHFRANAVKNAVEILNMMDQATPDQQMALEKITNYREQGTRPAGVQPLETFQMQEEDLSVADYLLRFTDARRIARAEKIKDSDLQITHSSKELVEAQIRDYYIEVDMKSRVLKHNCDDWRKGKGIKRICKHVGKLFLKLPPSQAKGILEAMWVKKDNWIFEE